MSKEHEASDSGGATLSRRRTYSTEQRRQIVAETMVPGASVSVVARRHDINTNLVFKWRQRYGEASDDRPVLVPVQIGESAAPCKSRSRSRPTARVSAGWIEIDLAGGHRVRIHGAADARTVRHVLQNLAR